MNYKDPSEKYAVILGYLIRNDGVKIQPSRFNKLANELGLDRQNKQEIQLLLQQIYNDDHLSSIYAAACNGEISAEDLTSMDDEESKPLQASEAVSGTLASYVKDDEVTKAQLREFRKYRREESHLQTILDNYYHKELGEVLQKLPKELSVDRVLKVVDGSQPKRHLALFPADWHIGALVNVHNGNQYNYTIFKQRLDELIDDFLDRVRLVKPQSIGIYHLGDLIEHINMRDVDQPFATEFPGSKQVALATGAIVYLAKRLTEANLPIELGLIAGNHDAFEGKKKERIHNDSFALIILDTLLRLKEAGALGNVSVIDNSEDIYRLKLNIFGKQVLCVHGDKLPGGKKKISTYIKKEPVDYLFYGHFHSWNIAQEDYGEFRYMCPSIMGSNTYSDDLNLPSVSASQAACLFEEGKAPVVVPIFFSK